MLLRFLTRREGQSHVLAHGRAVAAATGLAVICVAMAAGMLHWGAPYIAQQRWLRLIETATSDELPTLMGQLATRPDSTSLLIDLLDHDRPELASAAKSAIAANIASWQELPADASSQTVASLADSLAERTPDFRARGRHLAANLVDMIIDWPLEEDADATEFLLNCETVIRNDPGAADLWDTAAELDPNANATPLKALPISLSQRSADNTEWEGVPVISGGGLSAEPLTVPFADVPERSSAPDEITEETAPDRENNIPPAKIYEPLAIPMRLMTEFEASADEDAPVLTNEPAKISASGSYDAADRDDVELMRDLHDARHSADAEEELRRRGFDSLRIAIARRLTDDDPQVRKELADALPNIVGVSAAPWLEELAVDPQPEVRRVAIAILGTSGDPNIETFLNQLRRQESNPQVAELIDGILEKRR